MHLPHLSEKLTELANATSDEKEDIVNDYLEMVAQPSLITKTKSEHSLAVEHALKENASEQEDSMGNIALATNDEEEIASDNTFDLDSVKVIPFDFSINEAANELALPSSLVSEFIVDFIDQAKENLPVLQKAYNDKDIDMLQNTAHMLKGASSNLRITPIAETLYELQFNTELERVPGLIELFAGQLKSLDHQMNQ
jgi:HPt (histidine-containing phosphotransfer) domain-containing protein